jgi:transposase
MFAVKVYLRETTEAILDGHASAFNFFGGVPCSILDDDTTIALAKICGDGKRERKQFKLPTVLREYDSGQAVPAWKRC